MTSSQKIVTIVGNRPQFIKMAPVSRAIKEAGYQEIIVHTGQHYDPRLSDVFFEELGIAEPDYRLVVHEKTHGRMTAALLTQLEDLFLKIAPQSILVYGDTNSTLAAMLAAVKMRIKIAHVEAGPRIHDIRNPEEINRIMTDHASTLLFCPDLTSVQNLARENITKGVFFVGDVMLDVFLETQQKMQLKQPKRFIQEPFVLMTLHRAENVDQAGHLRRLFELIQLIHPQKILFPLHLRTLGKMKEHGLYETFKNQPNLILTEPLGYGDMVAALSQSSFVVTDSGGLQKEAYFASKSCFVCFYETPWPDLLKSKWLTLLGTLDKMDFPHFQKIQTALQTPKSHPPFFGEGKAAEKIVATLEDNGFFY